MKYIKFFENLDIFKKTYEDNYVVSYSFSFEELIFDVHFTKFKYRRPKDFSKYLCLNDYNIYNREYNVRSNDSFKLINKNRPFKIISIVTEITKKFIDEYNPDVIKIYHIDNNLENSEKSYDLNNRAKLNYRYLKNIKNYKLEYYNTKYCTVLYMFKPNIDISYLISLLPKPRLILNESIEYSNYPLASNIVDGREVLDKVPNVGSISASLTDYEILRGIREVSMNLFDVSNIFYNVNDYKRSKELSEKIRCSGEISPLIVVVDRDGPYILEGVHRLVALNYLNAKSFPALVVINFDDI